MENEEYNPVEPNYYNYKGKNSLHLELPRELNTYDYIFMCPYNINNDGKFPFLKFLLTNSVIDKTLNFPLVPVFKNFDTCELINFSKICLFGLMLLDNFEKFNENVEFNGFYENNNNLYLFFDISNCNPQIYDTYSNNNLWLVLLDEILNHKKMCNMVIDEYVTDFFKLNESFCFLTDKNEDSYEIPIVGYVKKPENKLNFTYIFGETKRDKNSILGPYYYFTDYISCFKDCNDSEMKEGIVRFSLFVGTTKYIENYHSDPIDESEIKKQRLCDDTLNQNLERLTMRVSDHDGKWTENYDSAFLGNVELDNGKKLNSSLIVLKEYNQQIPLSFHYIRNKKLNENSEDYLII